MSPLPLLLVLAASSLAIQDPPSPPESAEAPGTQISISLSTRIPSETQDPSVEALSRRVAELEAQLASLESPSAIAPPATEEPDPGAPDDTREITSFGSPVHVASGERVRSAVSFGGPVEVEGEVAGDAVAFGGNVRVRSTGRVLGDAVSFGGRVEVDPGGAVTGDRVAFASGLEPAPARASIGDAVAKPFQWAGSWVQDQVRRLVLLLSLAGAGVLVLGLFPDRVRRIAHSLEAHPFRLSIAGLLLAFAGLTATLLFAVTLVGLPVSGLLLAAMAMGWLLGFVALCQAAGDVLPFGDRIKGRLVAFLAGIAIVGALAMLPWIGKPLLALSLFPCLGAAIATRFGAASEGT